MTCHFSLGFCEGVAQHESLAFFANDSIDQAFGLAHQLAPSVTATNLRMLFCLEVGQKLLAAQCAKLSRQCEIEGLLDLKWFETPIPPNVTGLHQLRHGITGMIETIDTLAYEMKVRTLVKRGTDHISAELFSNMLAPAFRRSLDLYRKCIVRTIATLHLFGSDTKLRNRGRYYVRFLIQGNLSVNEMLTIFYYMRQITDTETISPWTTKLPIFPA